MTIHNQMNRLVAQPKTSGDGGLAFSISCPRLNLTDDSCGELFGVASILDRVSDVSLMGRPAEVAGNVVATVKILVMHVRKVFWIGDESFSNKARDKEGLLFSFFAQDQMQVSALVRNANDVDAITPSFGGSPFVGDEAVKATHSAQVRDFVQTFVSNNWLPLFTNGHDIPYNARWCKGQGEI